MRVPSCALQRRHCGRFLQKGSDVSFCYNYALCFIFLSPRTFASFHRDADEILMRPGTVGAPPGDPALEYFNCTFYAKCLPSKDATALELDELRAVKRRRRASRSHNAQSLYLSSAGSLRFLAPPKYCATAVRWLLGCERGAGAI